MRQRSGRVRGRRSSRRAAVETPTTVAREPETIEVEASAPGPLSPALATLVESEVFGAELRRRPQPTIALLGPARETAAAQIALTALRPSATMTLVDLAADASAAHVRLSVAGPFDLLLDLDPSATRADQVQNLLDCFFHVAAGGAYVVADTRPATVRQDADGTVVAAKIGDLGVRDLLDRALTLAGETTGPLLVRDLAWLGRSTTEPLVIGAATLIRNRRHVRPRFRDDEIDPVLAAAPQLGRVVMRRRGGDFASRCDYEDNAAQLPVGEQVDDPYRYPVFHVPDLRLRRYERPVLARGQVVESRGLLLPDTFRHHRRPRLNSTYVHDVAARFGVPKASMAAPVDLKGSYFYFDSEWPGHFGHTLTEQISRLWAFERVRELDPGVKLITALPKQRRDQQLQEWEVDLLGAFGLEREDVLVFDTPVRPRHLYAATPMFSCPEYVHPGISEVWDHIADRLLATSPIRPDLPRSPRLFCTRPETLKRPCHNTAEVEAYFASRGFSVVRPELFTLAEQITMFRSAEVVAGFAGSGLFTMAFVPQPITVLMISPDAYTARNEWMFASVRGHRLRVCWSRSDVQHSTDAWSVEAFSSGFSVDFAREGRYLDDVVTGLDDRPGQHLDH